jgi:hypothetical protein
MDSSEHFEIPKPESTDPPDGPSQLGTAVDAIDELFTRAGAQALSRYVDAEQSTTSTGAVLLGTQDKVDGLTPGSSAFELRIRYQALARVTSGQTGTVLIVIGDGDSETPVFSNTRFLQASPAATSNQRVMTSGSGMSIAAPSTPLFAEPVTLSAADLAGLGLAAPFYVAVKFGVASGGQIWASKRELHVELKDFEGV